MVPTSVRQSITCAEYPVHKRNDGRGYFTKDCRLAQVLRKYTGWDNDKLPRGIGGVYNPEYNMLYFDMNQAYILT